MKPTNNAHNRRDSILKFKSIGTLAFLELGKHLYEAEKDKDYETLGFETMSAYIGAPEASGGLDISKSWLLEFKLNYEKYVIELKIGQPILAKLSPAKLSAIRTTITQENADEWLNKIENLSLSDIRSELQELKGVCEHEPMTICTKCHKRIYATN